MTDGVTVPISDAAHSRVSDCSDNISAEFKMARAAHRRAKDGQTELRFRTWGGKRDGAGRPRAPDAGVSHAPRPRVPRWFPAHVTLRAREHVWNLRSRRAMRVVEPALAAVAAKDDSYGFRVVHFSVQGNHLHLIVEANGTDRLSSGMQGLSIRLARGLNRLMDASGPVWADRYHAHVLRTPREVRNALAYVLLNHRSHMARLGQPLGRGGIDPFSSGATFDGWKDAPAVPATPAAVTSPPRSWLLTTGWRRSGLLSVSEVPAARGESAEGADGRGAPSRRRRRRAASGACGSSRGLMDRPR
jgi:REP element-mobilizing transposase RayT